MPKFWFCKLVLAGCLILAGSWTATAQTDTTSTQWRDLLNLDSGALVLSWSSQYNEEWAALLLLDQRQMGHP